MLLWSGSVARWFPCYAVGLYGRHLASEGYQAKTGHVEVDQEALEAMLAMPRFSWRRRVSSGCR